MSIMFNVEIVALRKSKSLCFASKETFLKSDDVKSIDKKMMKSMMDFPLVMEVSLKVRFFFFPEKNSLVA